MRFAGTAFSPALKIALLALLRFVSFFTKAITQDIERFADSVAELYSNITKPVLDMLVYVRRLSDKVSGWQRGVWSGVGKEAQGWARPWR